MVVRVEAGDHRGRGGSRPRRRADRLVEAHAAGRELVDRRRGDLLGPVAADVVDAQRVRDPDDEVHARSRRRRPRADLRGPRNPSGCRVYNGSSTAETAVARDEEVESHGGREACGRGRDCCVQRGHRRARPIRPKGSDVESRLRPAEACLACARAHRGSAVDVRADRELGQRHRRNGDLKPGAGQRADVRRDRSRPTCRRRRAERVLQARGVGSWSTSRSMSARNCVEVDCAGSREHRDAASAGTNRRFRNGLSSPTGTPFRVTMNSSPRSSARMISPLWFRSSRCVIFRATVAS